MKPILLVDGHSVLYRSHYAFANRPLRNSRGMNTSAVFGFTNTLRKLLKKWQPEYCAVVFDAPGKTFRHEKFDQYKIQRPPMPEELGAQIPLVKQVVAAMGITSFEVGGVEADDVLGTMARRLSGDGHEVILVTSDKDMLQLVDKLVTTYDPWQDRRLRPPDVRRKFGVEPTRIADYLALTGDTSDNVPGVPGIGPKRAVAVLAKHGTLEDAIGEEPRIQPHREVALLSLDLVRIRTDVDVRFELEDARVREESPEELRRLYEELEFGSLLRELPRENEANSETELLKGELDLGDARMVGFSLDPEAGLCFSTDESRIVLVPEGDEVSHRRLLEAGGVLKACFDLKDALRLAWEQGLDIEPPFMDIGVAAWLVDPNRRSYSAEDLLVWGGKVVRGGTSARPAQALSLAKMVGPELTAVGLDDVLNEIEMPLVPVLARMEARGLRIDRGYLSELRTELERKQQDCQQRIWDAAGTEFNIGSPKQLAQVLFEKFGLPRGRRTKTGYSTSVSVLKGLADRHPVVREVLEFRELAKLCNTYIGPLLRAADPDTSRVHARFNQTGAATGRLSSSNPNLQNVPIRTEVGRRIRTGFVAGEGNVLVSADYSQIELRVLAHVSGDKALKAAFAQGEDIHVQTAATVFGCAPESVTPEQRRMAKVVNYGLIYGMGDFGLSSRMEMPLDQARGFLDDYMARFRGVADWRDEVVRQAEAEGYVRTVSGRVRPIPGIAAKNRNVAEAAKRAATNAPIQGSAADIIKRAMIRLDRRLLEAGILPGMLVQVHDELLFEVPGSQSASACAIVKEEMEQAWQLDVPLVVDIGTGRDWGEAH